MPVGFRQNRHLIFNPTLRRRIGHALLYELGALLILIPASALLDGVSMLHFGALAVLLSLCAMLCNMLYQHGFEWVEARFALQRTFKVRIFHAMGFELFFTLVALPIIAWWLAMGWLEALFLDLALTSFFLVYTFFFNWCYDIVRGKLRRD